MTKYRLLGHPDDVYVDFATYYFWRSTCAPLDPPHDEDPSEGDWESEGGAPAPDSDDE